MKITGAFAHTSRPSSPVTFRVMVVFETGAILGTGTSISNIAGTPAWRGQGPCSHIFAFTPGIGTCMPKTLMVAPSFALLLSLAGVISALKWAVEPFLNSQGSFIQGAAIIELNLPEPVVTPLVSIGSKS